MSAQPKLEKVLTIPEVAAIAGWGRRRMYRHLMRLHERIRADYGGSLLHNIGSDEHPRWTVTLAALRQAAPAWFSDAQDIPARIAELEAEVARLKRLVDVHGKTLEALVA